MTPELQKYYEQRLSMMGEPAWDDLMTDVAEMIKATDTLSNVTDEKSLHFRKGEISIMRWILSLREVSEKAYEDLQNEDA